MNRLFRHAFLLAGLLACTASPAAVLVDLHLRDPDRNEWLQAHPHEGRRFVVGEPGRRYAIVLQNLTPGRVLAVVSVDGVNVVTGQTADPGQAGYVLGPWEQVEVRGWRKSLGEVASFRFAAVADSYAARTGRPGEVGVVAVAAFREREAPVPAPAPLPGIAARDAGPMAEASAPAARSAGPAAQSLGTAHGERRADPAREVRFERASRHPESVRALYYDGEAALLARGVLPPPAPWRAPEPFPGGFVPDPD